MLGVVLCFISLMFTMSLYGDKENCYDTAYVEIILNYKELGKDIVFTNYNDITASDSTFIMKHHSRWFFRRAATDILDDIGFLDYVGLNKKADRLREERIRNLSRKRMQAVLGIPAGILLTYGGFWWLGRSEDNLGSIKELDHTLGGIAITGGIVLAGTVVWSYLKARKVSIYKHTLTFVQALNMVSRYNNLLRLKCSRAESLP